MLEGLFASNTKHSLTLAYFQIKRSSTCQQSIHLKLTNSYESYVSRKVTLLKSWTEIAKGTQRLRVLTDRLLTVVPNGGQQLKVYWAGSLKATISTTVVFLSLHVLLVLILLIYGRCCRNSFYFLIVTPQARPTASLPRPSLSNCNWFFMTRIQVIIRTYSCKVKFSKDTHTDGQDRMWKAYECVFVV